MLSFRTILSAASTILILHVVAAAEPITGLTYTYDFSIADPGTGQVTMFHEFESSQDPDLTKLIDGDPGSEELIIEEGGMSVFSNGTWVGVRNEGFGGAPQPKIDFNLGGLYIVDSVNVTYLVEDPTSIYAPQPVPDGMGGILFDALTILTSTDIDLFDVAGATNDFRPIFGPGGDFFSGVRERRSVTVSFDHRLARNLTVEVHTPFSFIFLGEVTINALGLAGDMNGDGALDAFDVNPFEIALADRDAYAAAFPDIDPDLIGDLTGDGVLDAFDVAAFEAALAASGGAATVPEPAMLILILAGGLAALRRRRAN